MKSLLLAGAALLLPALGHAQAPAFDTGRVIRDIKTLSSDAFEGRGPATPAEARTVDYIIRQMQGAGLQPGGSPDARGVRGWTQDVPLLKAEITGTPRFTLAHAGTAGTLRQGEEIAVRAALTGQSQVTLKDAPLIFVGYGVRAPERKWDDFKGVDVRGKILVVLVNDPDFEGGEGDFGGKLMTYYGRWTYKYEEAARLGAAGVMIVHETAPASYGWAIIRNSNTIAQFDIVRKDAAAHTPVEAWIQRDVAQQIFAASGLDFEAARKAAQKADFRPMPLKATFSADFRVKPEVITSKNVAGILPGQGHPDETVIYSAHWDHIGISAPDAKGDRINNGAMDNASGVAMMLEAARAFAAGPRPDRSVLFLAVTAEEKGLLGSEYYSDNPLYPLAKTVGVINMDSPIGHGRTRDFTISGVARLDLLDMLSAEGAKQGRRFTPDAAPEAGHFYRSDHFPFAKRGVPALSYSAGLDLVEGGTARGTELAEAYTRDRYHQPADQYDDSWDMAGVPEDLALVYNLGRDLAGSRVWPNWGADSEFRAARDKTAAERK
ncbi:M28 family metallopeptidase [Sphingomonas quercus]|uniref:M20/M25/M40 family metallo-hydrolase n=1 Tax=Sphingomonas quercus TaxID=2842451 RepID=A0ABS6BK77_9SPHN|nr:M28 family metallopeptidase [Sphingomonas quercus]MBU3078705.1 M20/M25/M40 family metallo-hydrolase [Sphingomonas quercus]